MNQRPLIYSQFILLNYSQPGKTIVNKQLISVTNLIDFLGAIFSSTSVHLNAEEGKQMLGYYPNEQMQSSSGALS